MVGTKTEMERLLKDATKITGIKYDIKNLSDVYEAIHVIQGELGITGTTAKEATETLQGSLSSFKASWNNFLSGSGNLGQVVDTAIIFVENIIRIVGEAVPFIIDNISKHLPKMLELGGQIFQKIIDGILNNIPQLINTTLQIIQTLMAGIIQNLPQILEMGIQILQQLVLGISQMLPTLIPKAVECIITIVETLLDNIDLLIDAGIELIMALAEGIINALPILIEKVPIIIQKLINAFFRNFPKLLKAGVQLIAKLIPGLMEPILQSVITFIKDNWQSLLLFIVNPFAGAFKLLYEHCEDFRNFIDNFVNKVKEIFNKIIEFFKNNWQGLLLVLVNPFVGAFKLLYDNCEQFRNFINNIISQIKQFFIDLWENIKNGAQTAWDNVQNIWHSVGNWFNDTIINPINNFFDEMWNKLKNGASNAWNGIKNVFSNVTSWFRNQFTEAWTAVKNVFSTGGKIFTGIKEGIVSAFKTVVNAIIGGINRVIKVPFDGINNALNTIRNVGIGDLKPFTNLPRISTPQIPQLEWGGILKRGQVGLLEGRGDEAIVPLHQNKKWIKAVAEEMHRAVLMENGAINSNASVKSNHSLNNVINAKFDIEGNLEVDGQRLGRIVAPYTMQTIRTGGAY